MVTIENAMQIQIELQNPKHYHRKCGVELFQFRFGSFPSKSHRKSIETFSISTELNSALRFSWIYIFPLHDILS